MERFVDYFTRGTEQTITGGKAGMEIETDFFLKHTYQPIPEEVTKQILQDKADIPKDITVKLELAQQKIEINVSPKNNVFEVVQAGLHGLHWLYNIAAKYGAYPRFEPEVIWPDHLLWIQEERDKLWVEIDGRLPLEHLYRCSSVQFTIDVNPLEAIPIINELHKAKLHRLDYAANDRLWKRYIQESKAKYDPERYGGPSHFNGIEDYVKKLTKHPVMMHNGHPTKLNPLEVSNLDINLYLRSVWWHYRLRRYGNSLCVEIRPFSRRKDFDLYQKPRIIKNLLGI